MAWSLKDSKNIYTELRVVSAEILKAIGCHTEPHAVNGKGRTRTCSFKHGRFVGILYHYTAGIAEVGTIRWGNHVGWGNTGSSWHVTVLDRIPSHVIGEVWSKIDDELRLLFPVPTIIMADWDWGTWHGNWTNNVTLGVENRNAGYSKMDRMADIGKVPVEINGKKWEPYTREQMICNVNLGRLANGYVDGQLDPDWVMTHQCIRESKMDCGPAYPIHSVRSGIFDDVTPVKDYSWLAAHPMAPDDDIDFDIHFKRTDEQRVEALEEYVEWVKPSSGVEAEERDPAWIASALYKLGMNAGPELPDQDRLRKMVRWYQRSTEDLTPDGIVGSKTETSLKKRLLRFGIVT